MRSSTIFQIIILISLIFGCAKSGIYMVPIQYPSLKKFSSLHEKIGSTVAIPPSKDERPDTIYIGRQIPIQGVSSYYKSDPFPLENAITQTVSTLLSGHGIKTISIPYWDGNPESLKGIKADSVLMIEIKKFWTESKSHLFYTEFKTSMQFVFHLGIKKETKVVKRNFEAEKEGVYWRLDPEMVGDIINEILGEILNSFFLNPY